MTSRKSKSEADKHTQAIREIQSSCPENKKCFECGQRGPTYVNMTIGAFVCTKCSGMLRGINPPHRIKSISMSSFTSDEVDFLRNKGNIYCHKVWLGLYDKSHGFSVDLKDDEAVKEFIIQKYEKKRYYVDPSSIRHSVGSSASSSSTLSQPSSTDAKSLGSGMIGTTIQLHGKSRPGAGSTTGSTPAAAAAASTSATQRGATSSPANISLPAPPSSAAAALSKPPAAQVSLPPPASSAQASAAPAAAAAASNSSSSSFSSNIASLAGLSVDPFAAPPPPSAPQQQSSAQAMANFGSSSGFATAFPPAPAAAAAKPKVEENFANFDAAVFQSPQTATQPDDPLTFHQSKLQNQQSSSVLKPFAPPQQQATSKQAESAGGGGPSNQDRYAALKDLDEIFKSTVVMSEAPKAPVGVAGSTGASIFGTSPVSTFSPTTATPAAAVAGSALSAVRSATPPSSSAAPSGLSAAADFFAPPANNGMGVGASLFGSGSGSKTSVQSNWAQWPSSSTTSSTTAPPDSTTNGGGGAHASQTSANGPINPFTGASNLTQLNTSPWPTTGTSPVQTMAPAWPPFASSSSTATSVAAVATSESGGGFNGGGIDSHFQMGSTSGGGGGIGSTTRNTTTATSSAFLDPFGAAPTTSNMHHASTDSDYVDLFANAPKPSSLMEDKNSSETTSGFGLFDKFPATVNGGNNGFASSAATNGNSSSSSKADSAAFNSPVVASDPWAASSQLPSATAATTKQNGGSTNLFTSSMVPAANPNNPFL